MRIKRFLAGLLAGTMMTGCVAIPAFAYTGEESSETEAVTEAAEANDTGAAETGTSQPYNVTVNEDGTMTITYNGEEFTLGGDDSDTDGSIGTGKVANVGDGSYLNLRDGAGMSANIIGHLLPGTEVTVLGEEGDWYEVSISEQTGYVSKDYLDVVLNESGDSEMSEEMLTLMMLMMMQGMDTESTDSDGLTPDGNLTLVDDIGSSTESGQQFITLTTKAGNVFYLVIDRDDDGNENVHFLNLVDEADLYALLDEDAQAEQDKLAAAEATEPEVTEPETTGSDATDTTEPTEETEDNEEKSSNWAPLMLLVIVMIGGVAGFLYMTVTKKKKQQAAAKPDPDADYEDEDDAEYELPEDDGEEETDDDGQIYTDVPDSEEDAEPDEDNEPV